MRQPRRVLSGLFDTLIRFHKEKYLARFQQTAEKFASAFKATHLNANKA